MRFRSGFLEKLKKSGIRFLDAAHTILDNNQGLFFQVIMTSNIFVFRGVFSVFMLM